MRIAWLLLLLFGCPNAHLRSERDAARSDAGTPDSAIEADAGPGADRPDADRPAPAEDSLRLIAPLSGSTVRGRPALAVAAPRAQPFTVEVCRDTLCADVVWTAEGIGGESVARPSDLEKGMYFWRASSDDVQTPLWNFWVPLRSRRTAWEDTAYGAGGDLDGDGIGDLAYVLAGDVDEIHLVRSQSRERTLRVEASEQVSQLGRAGDLNGDGLGDLVVQTVRESRRRQPRAYWISGADPALRLLADDTGFAVGLGDTNGDGYGDLLLSTVDGITLYFGSSEGPREARVLTADSTGIGYAAGDVDGDQLADWVVARPNATSDESSLRGQVDVFFGDRVRPGQEVRAIRPQDCGSYADTRCGVGLFVAAGGDVTGDGLAEITVGSRGASWTFSFDGRTPLAPQTHGGGIAFDPSTRPRIAAVPRYVGDVNGDGLDELVAVRAVDSDFDGVVEESSLLVYTSYGFPWREGDAIWRDIPFDEHHYGDFAQAGDLNGDGWLDFVATLRSERESAIGVHYGGGRPVVRELLRGPVGTGAVLAH
ncbi:MAG: VCBS repeat-containing protein [Myxococcota bacterium]